MPIPTGTRKKKAVSGSGRHDAWRCMRVFKRFTVADIVRTSGISTDNLRRYLYWLIKEGYVAMEGRQGKPGQIGSYNKYRIVKDSVATPVMPRRKEVKHEE